MSAATKRDADEVIWHDAECGGYGADLPIWRQLSTDRGGPILDLGAGSGRVSLDLARHGHEVVAVDFNPVLLGALERRAAAAEVELETVRADIRSIGEIGGPFPLILAPMQLFHLLPAAADRLATLESARRLATRGGLMVIVLLDEVPELFKGMPDPQPDVREVDGWVYSSTPIAVTNDHSGIAVSRRRERVGPDGGVETSHDEIKLGTLDADQLAAEAATAGWAELERSRIKPTSEHVGSTAVYLEAADA